jgi:hypothetical protein
VTEITIHDSEPRYADLPIEWRPADGDHHYRGKGYHPVGQTFTTWDPCWVCGKNKDDGAHGSAWRTCSYCGSIHPADLLDLTAGEEFAWQRQTTGQDGQPQERSTVEWADWKYGYPHKLYIDLPKSDRAKFYSRHLIDHREMVPEFNSRFGHLGVVVDADPVRGLGWRRNPEL